MKEDNRNGQLERFFQHNPIEDPLYLKKYVKEHPDHKMAWYLLGREYAAQGKEGKAAYCFAQSGGIYEAFERQKIVVEGPLPTFPSTATLGAEGVAKRSIPSNKRSFGRVSKRLGLMIMMIIFAVLAIPASFEVAKVQKPNPSVQTKPPIVEKEAMNDPQQDTTSKQKLLFAESDWGPLLQKALSSSGAGTKESIIMGAQKTADGKWVEWNKAVKPIIGIDNGGGSGTGTLKYYNAKVCSCQAADSSTFVPVIERWMQDREQAIVLQSAIQAYRQKTGALPDQPEQLTKPYPDNLLPGISPEMQTIFPQALTALKEQEKAGGGGGGTQDSAEAKNEKQGAKEQNTPSSLQPKAAAEPLVEPLRIIIDTEKHRLALVSGSYIIRSYPVGLGGEKTPEGDFIISEKVRNPNGKSNGEFGSRGMTLSDTLYAIHGTNKPASVGKDESHGCIRMLQADVEELYDMVPGMTKVTIGKGILPDSDDGSGKEGLGGGAGRGKPAQSFQLPLQTNDSNPNKKYKWLD